MAVIGGSSGALKGLTALITWSSSSEEKTSKRGKESMFVHMQGRCHITVPPLVHCMQLAATHSMEN